MSFFHSEVRFRRPEMNESMTTTMTMHKRQPTSGNLGFPIDANAQLFRMLHARIQSNTFQENLLLLYSLDSQVASIYIHGWSLPA